MFVNKFLLPCGALENFCKTQLVGSQAQQGGKKIMKTIVITLPSLVTTPAPQKPIIEFDAQKVNFNAAYSLVFTVSGNS